MIEVRIRLSEDQARMLHKLSELDKNEKYKSYNVHSDPNLLIIQELNSMGLVTLHIDKQVAGIWYYIVTINRAGELIAVSMDFYPADELAEQLEER